MADAIYKILPGSSWPDGAAVVPWAEVDHHDGFMHLSAEHQVRETAAKHFAGRDGLVLLKIDPVPLVSVLRWEPSRGGDLFPHVYGEVPATAVIAHAPLPWSEGGFDFDRLCWAPLPW